MCARNDALCKLRKIYENNEVEENTQLCAELLHDLAIFHQDTNKWSFVCKCALLNGALRGTDDKIKKERIELELKELGRSLLVARSVTVYDFDILKFSSELKEKFQQKRHEIAIKMGELQFIPTAACGSELFAKEEEIIRNVRLLMEEISDFYSDRMEEISKKCVEVLGKPPCEFSHFAMGSLARQEITLYSDFESAIILGKEVDWTENDTRNDAMEYFRWYAVLFDIILINFGETPISLVGIEGLNNHYSKDKTSNWFYDVFISHGIMFDSCLPYASKNPFGRKPTYDKPEEAELILPAEEMLQYLTEHKTLQEGYHLTNMLLESRHIAGSNDLFKRFRSAYLEMANDLRKSIPYIQQDLSYTRENLEKFNLTPTFNTLGWSQHAKKSFYRPMSVHIPFLSRLCGVFGYPSTSHIVDKLKNDSSLSTLVAHNLSYGIAVANLVRLKVYSDRTKQSDNLTGAVHLIHDTSRIMNIFDAVGDRSAADYYEIALSVRSAVTETVKVLDDKIRGGENIDETIPIACFEKHLSERWNFKVHGDIYRRFQNFRKANESYERALAECRKKDGMSSRAEECNILMSLGLTNLHSLKFPNSLYWYGLLIELEKKLQRGNVSLRNIALALTMSAQCVTEMPPTRSRYQKYIDDAENLCQLLLSSDPDNPEFIKCLAELRDTEGFYFLRTKRYVESLKKYEEARVLFSTFFGERVSNNDTLKVQNGIAMCLLHLERFEEAVEMFDRLVKEKRSLIGEEIADITLSWYLRHQGIALSKTGKYEQAVMALEESSKIRSKAPGSNYDIFAAMANTNRFLSECHFRHNRYEEAIRSSEKVLKLVEKIPGTLKGKEFREIAEKIISDSKVMIKRSEQLEPDT